MVTLLWVPPGKLLRPLRQLPLRVRSVDHRRSVGVRGLPASLKANTMLNPADAHRSLGLILNIERQENRVSLVTTCGDFGFGPGVGGTDSQIYSRVILARFCISNCQS